MMKGPPAQPAFSKAHGDGDTDQPLEVPSLPRASKVRAGQASGRFATLLSQLCCCNPGATRARRTVPRAPGKTQSRGPACEGPRIGKQGRIGRPRARPTGARADQLESPDSALGPGVSTASRRDRCRSQASRTKPATTTMTGSDRRNTKVGSSEDNQFRSSSICSVVASKSLMIHPPRRRTVQASSPGAHTLHQKAD